MMRVFLLVLLLSGCSSISELKTGTVTVWCVGICVSAVTERELKTEADDDNTE